MGTGVPRLRLNQEPLGGGMREIVCKPHGVLASAFGQWNNGEFMVPTAKVLGLAGPSSPGKWMSIDQKQGPGGLSKSVTQSMPSCCVFAQRRVSSLKTQT